MPYKDIEKQKAAQRESYLKHKERVQQASKAARIRSRLWLDSIKEGVACADCGGIFPPFVMDYHHNDKETKKYSVSEALRKKGREAVLEEIKKCVLVCANCHRIREYLVSVV